MGQSIQGWTKWNLWKAAFTKNLKWYGLPFTYFVLSDISTVRGDLFIPNVRK